MRIPCVRGIPDYPRDATIWLGRTTFLDANKIKLPALLEQRFQDAGKLYKAGRADEAIAVMQALLAQAPDFARGWFLIGYIYGSRGRYSEAIAALERAVEL